MSDETAAAANVPMTSGRELVARVISAIALAAIALLGARFGGWAAAAVVAVVMAVAHLEWAHITERSSWPTAIFTAGLLLAIVLFTAGLHPVGLSVAVLTIVTSIAAGGGVWRPLGALYVSLLAFGVLALRLSPDDGLASLLFALVVVWATDTGAFFAGRAIGGARLWPRVSPNKTWAGAIGGVIAGVAAGLIALTLLRVPLSAALVLVAALLSLVAEAGDLFESFVKRQFGAKDSGWLVPGHGGLLDRVDGLSVAVGVAAFVGWVHSGAEVGQGLLTW
ncbi:MAG TPA: phosphatidate cytidylyltransferase [Bauldia sp.]